MAFLLIKHGADITYKTSDGTTVLDACTHAARVDMMEAVIKKCPTDIAAFKKALRIAYIQSRVHSSQKGELMPTSLKKKHTSLTVEPLLDAIYYGELLLLHTVNKQ